MRLDVAMERAGALARVLLLLALCGVLFIAVIWTLFALFFAAVMGVRGVEEWSVVVLAMVLGCAASLGLRWASMEIGRVMRPDVILDEPDLKRRSVRFLTNFAQTMFAVFAAVSWVIAAELATARVGMPRLLATAVTWIPAVTVIIYVCMPRSLRRNAQVG